MTLEDNNKHVMAARKDDVTRTQQQNRKRPLSAVLEEFEIDPEVFEVHKANLTQAQADKPQDSLSKDTSPNNSTVKRSPREAAGRCSNSSSSSTTRVATHEIRTSSTKPFSSPSTNLVSVSSLKAIFEKTAPPNLPRRSPESRQQQQQQQQHPPQTSPKISRAVIGGVPKLGRRSPSTSPRIPRRRSSSGFCSSVSSDASGDEDGPTSPPTPTSDMTRLRQMADRLCLSTRRASVQQWRARYVDSPELPVLWNSGNGDVSGVQNGDEGGRWTAERTERINTALDWIKNELQAMRTQDQQLARQLLSIRSDLHRLKLARSCEEHRDMLDDVQSELEELQEFADVLDLPTPTLTDSPLKHLGVTRMNFSARRFSTC